MLSSADSIPADQMLEKAKEVNKARKLQAS